MAIPTSPLHELSRFTDRTTFGDIDGTGAINTPAPRLFVLPAPLTRRRALPRIPPLPRPFGEERLRPSLEFVRRVGVPMPDPAPGGRTSAVP